MLREVVLVLAGVGCGARSTAPAATERLEPCVELSRHIASVVGTAASGELGPPLLVELWTSLFADACRQDRWSEPTFACYRAASTPAMLDACEDGQPEPERSGLRRFVRGAMAYLPARERAHGTREEVQARYVVPIWGHPPGEGDTFAACDAYTELLETLRSCEGYQDPYLRERIGILVAEREQFADRTPRIRAMWLGYCEAEAARRRRQFPECLAPAS